MKFSFFIALVKVVMLGEKAVACTYRAKSIFNLSLVMIQCISITLYIGGGGGTLCNFTSHNPSLKLRLPCKIILFYFKIYILCFVKIARKLLLQNYPTESKNSLDTPGKINEVFACGDKIPFKGKNSLGVA